MLTWIIKIFQEERKRASNTPQSEKQKEKQNKFGLVSKMNTCIWAQSTSPVVFFFTCSVPASSMDKKYTYYFCTTW